MSKVNVWKIIATELDKPYTASTFKYGYLRLKLAPKALIKTIGSSLKQEI